MHIPMPDGTLHYEADCVENCTGHLGKFDDCRTEALWGASLDWWPESTGSTEWHVWACILHFPVGEYLTVSPEATENENDGPSIWVPAGSYVLCTDDRGFVWIECGPMSGHGAAEARFKAIDDEYSVWCQQEESQS